MIELRSIVGTLYKPNGKLATGKLSVRLMGSGIAEEGLVQSRDLGFHLRDGRPVHVVDGVEVDGMLLWVTDDTDNYYEVREPDGEKWSAGLPAGDEPLDLTEWKEQGVIVPVLDGGSPDTDFNALTYDGGAP